MKKYVITAVAITLAATLLIPSSCTKPSEAEFEVTALNISPNEVVSGEPTFLTADVENIGGREETYTATLRIDGVEVQTVKVSVAAGEKKAIVFAVTRHTPGTYHIELDGLSGTLTVVKPLAEAEPPGEDETLGETDLGNGPCPPDLTSNPRKDVIVTNSRPLLSFFNSAGGTGERTYTIQIDKVSTFDSGYLIEYADIEEETPYVTSKLIEEGDELDDNTQYYWRARAIDNLGQKSSWAMSRFFLDTSSDDAFLELLRITTVQAKPSCGSNADNITDVGDAAAETYWEGCPDQPTYWVEFDLGETREVSRIWQLCDRSKLAGRLKDYVWQYRDNGDDWKDILETRASESNAFRRIIEFDATIATRYFRLYIEGWHSSVPQIHEIIFYSPGIPIPPEVPDTDYVLIVGNRHDGSTWGNIRKTIEYTTSDIETVLVPYYELSLDMVNKLEPQPVAIILSGFFRWYENLPMFEFNGEYELIRESNIPILGICGPHQMMAMAYGYTYARDMGYVVKVWEEEGLTEITPIDIVKEDPIFENISEPFVAPEWHGWEVMILPDDIEILATSDCIEVVKSTRKIMYGVQFHPEVELPFSEARAIIPNFLEIALEAHNSEAR